MRRRWQSTKRNKIELNINLSEYLCVFYTIDESIKNVSEFTRLNATHFIFYLSFYLSIYLGGQM